MVEIRSEEDLERWLENRPREDAVAIAALTALRVVPLLVTGLTLDAAPRRAALVLPVFRAVAAPWVADVGSPHGAAVRNATAAAGRAAAAHATHGAHLTATHAARTAAIHAAQAAATATAAAARTAAARAASAATTTATATGGARGAIWEAVSADATALEQGQSPEQLVAKPLWLEKLPGWAADAWAQLEDHLLAADEGWEVWTDWYQDRLHGRPFNKALEEARVLIPDEIWEQGPKAVNAEIARLIEEHVAKRTPQASTLTINPETGNIRAEPPARLPDIPDGVSHERLVSGICEKLAEQITYLRDPQRWNQFSALARQFDRIESFLEEPTLRPERLHDAFEAMARAIDIRLREHEIPDGEETAELRADVLHGMSDLRHCYPDLDAMVAARSARRPKTLSEDEAAALERILATVEEIIEHELGQELREDVEAVKEAVETLPAEASRLPLPEGDLKNRVYRLIGTLTRIKTIVQTRGGDLIRLLDRRVDAVKKAESYRKVAEALEPVWKPIWELLKSFLDGM